MNRNAFAVLAPLALAVAVSGCSSVSILDPLRQDGRITTTAAHALFSDNYEQVNLMVSLDPENKRAQGAACELSAKVDKAGSTAAQDEFGAALRAFYCYSDPEQRRNRLQDELFWRSENRCVIYKNYLKRTDTMQGTYTGIVSTVLSGVGAITGDLGRAQIHSALAAISSGIGAELKQGFFSDVAVGVLVPGIDEKRRQILERILARRGGASALAQGGAPITSYTMEAALRDVAEYHGACSILVGLDYAKESIREVRNPGMASIANAFATQRYLGVLANPKSSDAEIEAARAQLTAAGIPGHLPPRNSLVAIGFGDTGSATASWTNALALSTNALNRLEERVRELAADKVIAANANLKGKLDALLEGKKVSDQAGAQKGCGIAWLRKRVTDELSGSLTDYSDADKGILAARQNLSLAADEAGRITARTAVDDALATARIQANKANRYALLLQDGARRAAAKLEVEAAKLAEAELYAVADESRKLGNLALKTGAAYTGNDVKACP